MVWAVTSACIALCCIAFVASFCLIAGFGNLLGGIGLLAAAFLLLASVVVAEGYSPQCLEVGDEGIVILRRYASVEIPRSEIVSVKRISASALPYRSRFGAGFGLFGFCGRCRSHRIGSFRLYATEFRNLLVIDTTGGKFVVSCSEPEYLLGRFAQHSEA
ncbi:MAG: PH domain-containing protein [Alistipes sp.]